MTNELQGAGLYQICLSGTNCRMLTQRELRVDATEYQVYGAYLVRTADKPHRVLWYAGASQRSGLVFGRARVCEREKRVGSDDRIVEFISRAYEVANSFKDLDGSPWPPARVQLRQALSALSGVMDRRLLSELIDDIQTLDGSLAYGAMGTISDELIARIECEVTP